MKLKVFVVKDPPSELHLFLSLIDPTDVNCPIRRQAIPTSCELIPSLEFKDPLAEETKSPVPNLIHRYPDRIVVLVTKPVICIAAVPGGEGLDLRRSTNE